MQYPVRKRFYATVSGPGLCEVVPIWADDFAEAERLANRLLAMPYAGWGPLLWRTIAVDPDWDAYMVSGVPILRWKLEAIEAAAAALDMVSEGAPA